jgi:class 3 adenylate cyclase
VHQHFDTLSRVIRDRNSAIVKTIGDAVMVAFNNPVEATHAGLEMIGALYEFNQTIYAVVGVFLSPTTGL